MLQMIKEKQRRSNVLKKCFETLKNENRKSGKNRKNEKRKKMKRNSLSLIRSRQNNQALMEPFK